ncbi:MFS transporter [Streptomyces sp. NPDC058434]|uniref:MFS transporter n=1 Tax=Streptomyces sp. NPDC058434 TaxID=3346498 RepID=UPI003646C74D
MRSAGFAYPFLSFRLDELGFSTGLVGLILGAFGVGWLAGQLLSGALADRFGRRATLVGSMLTAAASLLLLAQARTASAVLAATVVAGAVYDAHRPIVSAAIQDLIPSEAERTRVNARRHLAVNVGAALAGAAGGLLVHRVGMSWLFWVNAAACLGFALIALRFVAPDPGHRAPGETSAAGRREAFADIRLWLLWLASLAALICAAMIFTALPILMQKSGLGAAAYGWTQVSNGLVVLIVSPLLGPWLSRRAASGMPLLGPLAASSFILGAGMAAAGLATTTAGYSLAVAVAVPGEVILFIAAGNVLDHISPPGCRGLYAGIWGTGLAVAIIAAPTLTAWALETGGGLLAAVTTATTGLLGAALCLPLKALTGHVPVPTAAPRAVA